MTTVPLAGWVTDPTDFGPPSTSVSLARTGTATAPESSMPWKLSLIATGLSSTAATLMLRVAEPVSAELSVTVNVTVRTRVDGSSEVLT